MISPWLRSRADKEALFKGIALSCFIKVKNIPSIHLDLRTRQPAA